LLENNENFCESLSMSYRNKQEPARGKLQGLFELASEQLTPINEDPLLLPKLDLTTVRISSTVPNPDDDMKRDFKKN